MKTYNSCDWDNIYKKGFYTHYPTEIITSFIYRRLSSFKNRHNIRILDLGCGTGNNTEMMSKLGFDVYGLDGSLAAINITRRRLRKIGLFPKLEKGNFKNLPYPDHIFNMVIDDACIMANSRTDIRIIFKEIYRVLKKRGIFYGRFINSKSKNMCRRNRTLSFLSLSELKRILKNTGFFNFSIDYFEITRNNQTNYAKFWIVECKK